MNRIRAVAFDLDGTLVRSMERHHAAYQHVFRRFEQDVTFHEVCAVEGRRAAEVIPHLAAAKGIKLSPDDVEALTREKTKWFQGAVPPDPYPGALEVVRRVRERGLGTALVTGTARGNLDHVLPSAPSLFDVTVTADDVGLTKPDPEPYLKAFASLGVQPHEAIVVENAPLGVEAARRAGAHVIAITTTLPLELLSGAHAVVPDFNALETCILEWNA